MTPEEWLIHDRDGFKSPGERSGLAPYMGKRKLNLGCGCAPEPVWRGWTNADINENSCAGVVFDAREPWPLKAGSYDTIFAYLFFHTLFAGEELFTVLSEAWRLLRPGGFLVAVVPDGHHGSPMQKSIWTERTPHMLCESVYKTPELATTGFDQGLPVKPWQLIGVEKPNLIWFVLRRP